MVAKAIIYYFLPLTIIGVLYALMARRLHLSAREMPGELAGPQSRAQARARRHVARMVVTFVIGKCTFIRNKTAINRLLSLDVLANRWVPFVIY